MRFESACGTYSLARTRRLVSGARWIKLSQSVSEKLARKKFSKSKAAILVRFELARTGPSWFQFEVAPTQYASPNF